MDLALEHFPRIVGIRDGRIAFDKPAERVTPDDLRALYANEQLGRQDSASPVGKPMVVQIPRC